MNTGSPCTEVHKLFTTPDTIAQAPLGAALFVCSGLTLCPGLNREEFALRITLVYRSYYDEETVLHAGRAAARPARSHLRSPTGRLRAAGRARTSVWLRGVSAFARKRLPRAVCAASRAADRAGVGGWSEGVVSRDGTRPSHAHRPACRVCEDRSPHERCAPVRRLVAAGPRPVGRSDQQAERSRRPRRRRAHPRQCREGGRRPGGQE